MHMRVVLALCAGFSFGRSMRQRGSSHVALQNSEWESGQHVRMGGSHDGRSTERNWSCVEDLAEKIFKKNSAPASSARTVRVCGEHHHVRSQCRTVNDCHKTLPLHQARIEPIAECVASKNPKGGTQQWGDSRSQHQIRMEEGWAVVEVGPRGREGTWRRRTRETPTSR